MNICIISGSARQNNNTIRVAKALEKMYASHHVQLIDFCSYDIPLVANGNLNADRLTAFQQGLYHAMNNAQLIYIITPEYNWSTTPEILNWLHRFGDKPFEQLFNNKVFALVGVSTGKGGKAPLLHLTGILHKIIGFLNLQSIISAKIFESHYTKLTLDEDGNLIGDEGYLIALERFANYNNMITDRWRLNSVVTTS